MSNSDTSFATTTGGISKTSPANPSFTLTAFKEAEPLNGPPGEWLQAGVGRSYGAEGSNMKDKMDVWDKEWVKLQHKK